MSDDTFVATGKIDGDVIFGIGEPNETILDSTNDMFLAKYNPDGTLIWATSNYGSGHYEIVAATMTDNSTVILGDFNGLAIFGKGEPNETTFYAVDSFDAFIARYNPDGSLAWAKVNLVKLPYILPMMMTCSLPVTTRMAP